jgi:hypothetical protein
VRLQDYCRQIRASDLNLLIPQYGDYREDPAFHVPVLGTLAEPVAAAVKEAQSQQVAAAPIEPDDVRCALLFCLCLWYAGGGVPRCFGGGVLSFTAAWTALKIQLVALLLMIASQVC